MVEVCLLDQLRKTYGFDRKSRSFWLRLFFQLFDYAINNAHILYKHSCKRYDVQPMAKCGTIKKAR